MQVFPRFLPGLAAGERSILRQQLAAVFIVITLMNLGFYWQRMLRQEGERRNVHTVMRGWDGFAWYVWMPVAPATLLLIRRYPFNRDQKLRSAARLAAGSAAIYIVVTNARYLLRLTPNIWLPDELDLPTDWLTYRHTQLERLPIDFLTYGGLFAASFAIDYYTKYRQRAEEVLRLQLQAAQLQSELQRVQLTALRGQLQPHFLFNSFNAISTLVRQGRNEQADETIVQLSELLRFVMVNIDLQELPFEQELAFVRCYLEVERVRFGERLTVAFDVPPETLGCVVPNLLLQPLVENAIKHGVARRSGPGGVTLTASRAGDRLRVEVRNDGPVLPPGTLAGGWPVKPTGIGLRNTRSRLDHVYGADYRFEITARAEGGAVVQLDLPWRDAAPAAGQNDRPKLANAPL
ncbi:MAG: histidine kinase [Verrucomicrobia bacterium]|nr:histidine kinase [Pseudomonadota bacterium]MBS0632746.1 histidine kinase [Verrucomicrobiota bacterium]